MKIVKTLLEKGANPNKMNRYQGNTGTPLIIAASYYHSPDLHSEEKEIIILLLKHKGDPFLLNDKGKHAYALGNNKIKALIAEYSNQFSSKTTSSRFPGKS